MFLHVLRCSFKIDFGSNSNESFIIRLCSEDAFILTVASIVLIAYGSDISLSGIYRQYSGEISVVYIIKYHAGGK